MKAKNYFTIPLLLASGLIFSGYIKADLIQSMPAVQTLQELVSVDEEFKKSLQFLANKQYKEALIGFQQVIMKKPDCAEAYFNIGLIFLMHKDSKTAAAALEKSAELDPSKAQPHLFLASIWQEQGDIAKSIAALKRALTIDPTHAQAHANLSRLYTVANLLPEAVKAYNRAIEFQPSDTTLMFEAGCINARTGDFQNALDLFRRVLRINPNHPEAHLSIAHIYTYLGKIKEALPHFHSTLEQWPEHRSAHCSVAEAYLALGEFKKGFAHREWRLSGNTDQPHISSSYWNNDDLVGKTVTIRAGAETDCDMVQFIRYAQLLKNRGASSLIVECNEQLATLLETNPSIDEFIPAVQSCHELPKSDIQIPLSSLPYVCNTTLESIPNSTPYITIPPSINRMWKHKLKTDVRLKVGISWYDYKQENGFSENTIPLPLILSALPKDHVTVYLLQTPSEHDIDQLSKLELTLPQINTLNGMGINADSLVEISGLVNNLDLVMSADNSIAHIAGALDKLTWVLLPKNAHWRWMQHRTDSPWYPSMTLFRQCRNGVWDDVTGYLHNELSALINLNQQNNTIAVAEVSLGELIDKMTILDIKLSKIRDDAKLHHLKNERSALQTAYQKIVTPSKELDELTIALRMVNETLWEIEDNIRYKEQKKTFDQEFVELARSVYTTNDQRFKIKNNINNLLSSRLKEVKELVTY